MTELNIINPKQLERQLKVLEGRIQELEKEKEGLERMRSACLVLMGMPPEEAAAMAENRGKPSLPGASKGRGRKKDELDTKGAEIEALDGTRGSGEIPIEALEGESLTPDDLAT